MAINDVAVRPEPVRSFILDLLYPGVWGAMIVLLFFRIANFGQPECSESVRTVSQSFLPNVR
jgi:hypothetical protein